MISLLQKVADKFDVEKRSAESEWSLLVARIADGTATEVEVAKALKATGRTLEDLQAAVVRQQRIAELQVVALGLPDAKRRADQETANHAEFCLRRQTTTNGLAAEWTERTSAMNEAVGTLAECQDAQRELEAMTGSTIRDVVEAA